MGSMKRIVIVSIISMGILVGSVGFVYVMLPTASSTPQSSNVAIKEEVHAPEVRLYKRRGGVTLAWSNLPLSTTQINIYRTQKGKESWVKWKTINVDSSSLALGSVVIDSKEDLANYYFYAEVLGTAPGGNSSSSATGSSGSGAQPIILWQSSSTVIEPPPDDLPGNPTSTPNPQPGNLPTPSGTPNPAPAPTPQASSTPPAGPGTSNPPQSTSTVIYYTPSGTISGSSTVQTHADFWVERVNGGIEVGWQNLPAGTETVIVYRATGESGPWLELLTQTDPDSPSSLRMVDNTLYIPHYYRMEAIKNHIVVSRYGPLYLPAMSQ
ncbi:MAG: hypothetical protein V1489_00220 [Candidatus Liptonbacteria bacterium]